MPDSVTTGSLSIEIRNTENGTSQHRPELTSDPDRWRSTPGACDPNTVDVPVVDPTLSQVAPFSR
ncbi:MAG: hypothetical protein IPL99_07150 [Candidatus Competibacteraceae bacterium]|nr:hypothetical protein [Candidatus Competibacteraceae bacterium]